ncbi:unnamed protein product [Sphenostylis stenocarpa]|uniref:Uncharacterized protein n=1 Tax=Sphenostylis stenocarpa TaxID=92480 RepID=A0AA86SBC0_9FABA|nr:unnamed protein product [Sphenostylis stenocarpa]
MHSLLSSSLYFWVSSKSDIPRTAPHFTFIQKTIWVAITTFIAYYCLASLGRLMYAIRDHRFDTLINLSGSLSLLCLVVLLLPEAWESFGFVIYTVCFITHVLCEFITNFREVRVERGPMRRVVRPVLPIPQWISINCYITGSNSALLPFLILYLFSFLFNEYMHEVQCFKA